MKYEFHAEYPFALQDSLSRSFAIPYLVKQKRRLPARWPEIQGLADDFTRILLLSQAVVTPHKEEARMGTRRMPGGLRFWVQEKADRFLSRRLEWMENIGLLPSPPALEMFPPGSWSIQFTFTLREPYISRDDTDFYILDNPVRKEWVFKVPYVAPSQWKGALRATMMRDLASDMRAGRIDENQFVVERLRLYRLFGNEKDGAAEFLNRSWAQRGVGPRPEAEAEIVGWEKRFRREVEYVSEQFERRLRECGYRVGDVEGFHGRLHFYPTFFDKIGLEVINPHDRKTSAGEQPIYFECVPGGTKGKFALLCVPPDGASEGDALADLEAVVRGVRAMLTRYGFGAKTSSGYGVTEEPISEGQIRANAIGVQQQIPAPPEPSMTEALKAFRQQFPNEDFSLKPSEWRKQHNATTSQRNQYKDARREFRVYQEAQEQYRRELAEQERLGNESTPSFIEETFDNLASLPDVANAIAGRLRAGGAV